MAFDDLAKRMAESRGTKLSESPVDLPAYEQELAVGVLRDAKAPRRATSSSESCC